MESTVLSCAMAECAYNNSKECHAPSVSIGSDHAVCDTFTKSGAQEAQAMPDVAACHVGECRFNKQLACEAPGITVGQHGEHADCSTFVPAS